MVRLEGFEPPTNRIGTYYSIQLSYKRKKSGSFQAVIIRVYCSFAKNLDCLVAFYINHLGHFTARHIYILFLFLLNLTRPHTSQCTWLNDVTGVNTSTKKAKSSKLISLKARYKP